MILHPAFNVFNSREELVNSIRECAQDLIDNAEEYVGSVENLESIDIRMYFKRDAQPRTDIETDYMVIK